MFKQKQNRNFSEILQRLFYPKGGWRRAIIYIWYRIRRIPDPPGKIGRGVFAGVWACFTPFFGFHVLVAAILAFLLRGNILAALLATLFGNPLTFPLIAAMSISLGHQIVGDVPVNGVDSKSMLIHFQIFFKDLALNLFALFTERQADWTSFAQIYRSVFLPYLIGGAIPGLIFGVAAGWLTKSVVVAYRKRRKAKAAKRKAAAAGSRPRSLLKSLLRESRMNKPTEGSD
ncbi:MAG: DUF2062 domain-containing protein [Albidovulum sp.]|nr:DUF2062 domain-containing protein [Albidovulum sp.]